MCDDEWGLEDAGVVCRQLGYLGVERATVESEWGQVSSSFIMDNVECAGDETGLEECDHKTGDDCDGHEAAGVVCTNLTTPLPPHCLLPGSVCLVGGDADHAGNVYYSGHALCHNGWDFSDANVVCKSLGFIGADNFTTNSEFGLTFTYFSMSRLRCRGDEVNITECEHEAGGRGCDAQSVAGVICHTAHDDYERQVFSLQLILGLSLAAGSVLFIYFVVVILYKRSGDKIRMFPKEESTVSFSNPIRRVARGTDTENLL